MLHCLREYQNILKYNGEMIDPYELLFVVDENNQPLDPLPRNIVHNKGYWHRTTGIWVINHNKDILCQKRSLKKDNNPGMWEALFGGHVGAGMSYEETVIKELAEELGITPDVKALIHYKILRGDHITKREFQHSNAYLLDRVDTDFNVEKEEVDEVTWFPYDEVFNLLIIHPNARWVQKTWDKEMLNWIKQLKY